jgi:hypothetical protein
VLLYFQGEFSSYLIFSCALGAVFGSLIGAVFGAADGIIIANRYRTIFGILRGFAIGSIGGIGGFLTGQAVLLIFGEMFLQSDTMFSFLGLPLSRALGWGIMGLFAGSIDAVRRFTGRRLQIGFAGGMGGGFIGGFVFEYMQLVIPTILGRLIGLILFGTLLGLFYGLVESRLSFGKLTVLNGPSKGKVFPVVLSQMKIGTSKESDICLEGYRNVSKNTRTSCY